MSEPVNVFLTVTDDYTDDKGKVWRKFSKEIQIQEATYIRFNTKLLSLDNYRVCLSWVTISVANVKMKGIRFSGLLQVTAKGSIHAKNCTFEPSDSDRESVVEVFAQSSSKFTNCTFHNASKSALLVRDRSKTEIIDCTFEKNAHSSLLLLDSSSAEITRTNFKGANRFAVYVYRKSSTTFTECSFRDMAGKAVFILYEGNSRFSKCRFNKCLGGAISLAETSIANVSDCSFDTINYSAVHGIKNCFLSVENSSFIRCKGNGVNFEHSNGYVSNSNFEDFQYPIFAVFGPNARPDINNCKITKFNTFAAIARDCAIPVFENLDFSNGKSHCFSISDFACALVRNCNISQFAGAAFSIYNGAKIIAEYNKVKGCELFAKLFLHSTSTFRNNYIEPGMSISREYGAKYEFVTNVALKQETDKVILESLPKQTGLSDIKSGEMIISRNKKLKTLNPVSMPPASLSSVPRDVIDVITDSLKRSDYDPQKSLPLAQKKDNHSSEILKDLLTHVSEQIPKENHKIIEEKQETNEPEKQQCDCFDEKSILGDEIDEKAIDLEDPNNITKSDSMDEVIVNSGKIVLSNKSIKLDDVKSEPFEPIDVDELTDQPGFSAVGSPKPMCFKCKQHQAEVYLSPCGHCVFCEECAKNEQFCPLCSSAIQKSTKAFDSGQCLICYGPHDTILFPCGHLNICYACAMKLWSEGRKCPECREKVISFRHIFPMCDL